MMQALKDRDERQHPERLETAGVSFLASNVEKSSKSVTKKDGKGTGGANALKAMMASGDYTGITTSATHAYMTEHAKRVLSKRNAKSPPVFQAKGKGAGKRTFNPRDRSNDICNNCDIKGHWAPDCPLPRRDHQSNNRPASSSYVAKGKGKGGKGKLKRNPAKGSSPY